MPSPFPGMDPWLEDPNIFPDLHNSLIVLIKFEIQRKLKPPYYTAINSRVWLEAGERYVEPDADVLRRVSLPTGNGYDAAGTAVATSAATLTEPLVIRAVPNDESEDTFLEIHTRYADGRERLVTSIEVLSPHNKKPGQARDLYKKKYDEVLAGQSSLVEIDLLRGGSHATAVPHAVLARKAKAYDYHVCTTRFEDPYTHYNYPFLLADRLPTIAVPLLPEDGFVPLDVAKVFNECYDASPYRYRIQYRELEPVPPLTAEQRAWADGCLRAAGMLPPA